MKKFLFLLLFLTSCKREFCWDCELTTGRRNLPFQPVMVFTTSQIEYCDRTEAEIAKIISAYEYTTGISSYSHMTCKKR
jgi:hypothetical protein